jgi:cell division protein ZapD
MTAQPGQVTKAPAAASTAGVYEQPLSERVRIFLRIEHQFGRVLHHLRADEAESSLAAAERLLELLALLNRGDVRTELLKESDRIAASLSALGKREDVDAVRLAAALDHLEQARAALSGDIPLDRRLRDNEFLGMLRQRQSIPGGYCSFDMPRLKAWLDAPPGRRREDLQAWLSDLAPFEQAADILLGLLRESGALQPRQAAKGFFQQNLPPHSRVQLIRVVPGDAGLYPEISGGKHRFTIRFLDLGDLDGRPAQATGEIPFRLALCQL